ncbi:hypothetical protein H2198_010167 [Neophaeococcomyces mojaviensis]|uniref:Uncharacterized protein n=1 Tax=Neophaeococcomyces mojaviensis TaxID=3383035 RepID=A0ACC2ZSK2_9EURO|nr:hypothetical protein H2198_010167 [Knufia sp. JES_112]
MVPAYQPQQTTTQTFRPVFTQQAPLDPTAASVASVTLLGKWASFPFHTRHERNGPAGISDGVRARDFQQEQIQRVKFEQEPDPKEGGQGKRKQTVLLKLKRFSRSTSMEWRNGVMARGHRSSVSAGRSVEYPELEMLPGERVMR